MGMNEGRVVTWYHKVGDVVALDEALVEVEAEKTSDDVNAPAAGTILQILVPAGDTVPVRTVLALIGEPGEALDVTAPAPAAPISDTVASGAATSAAVPPQQRSEPLQATPVARKV